MPGHTGTTTQPSPANRARRRGLVLVAVTATAMTSLAVAGAATAAPAKPKMQAKAATAIVATTFPSPKVTTRPTRPPSTPPVRGGTPAPTTPAPTTPAPTTPAPTTPAPTTPAPGSAYGVPAGTVLKASTDVTVSTPGAVVTGLDIDGCLTVTAANVTVKNSRVRGTCPLVVSNRAPGLVLDHVEIDGMGDPETLGIGYSDYTARAVYIHGVGDGIRANGNVVLENSLITDLATGEGSHNDSVQITQGSNIRLSGNVIENPYTQTSAIMIGADQGSIANVLVTGNVLAGGGYTVYGGAQPPAGNTISGIVIRDNQFSKKYYPRSGAYGPLVATDDSRISVTGNVWEGTTTPIG